MIRSSRAPLGVADAVQAVAHNGEILKFYSIFDKLIRNY